MADSAWLDAADRYFRIGSALARLSHDAEPTFDNHVGVRLGEADPAGVESDDCNRGGNAAIELVDEEPPHHD